MKKSFLVIGLGRFGYSVCLELLKNDVTVLAIDNDKENVLRASDILNNVAICDATRRKDLKEIGAAEVDHAIIAIGNNLYATMMSIIHLKELGVSEITARIDDNDYNDVLLKLGATSLIIPQEASAISLANKILSRGVLDYYNIKGDYSIVQFQVSSNFEGISLNELSVRQKFDVNIVAIIRDKDTVIIPQGTDYILFDDVILIIGHKKNLKKFESFIKGE